MSLALRRQAPVLHPSNGHKQNALLPKKKNGERIGGGAMGARGIVMAARAVIASGWRIMSALRRMPR